MADAKDLENGSANNMNDFALDKARTHGDNSTSNLRQMLTNNTISDEQFERLFLSPRNNVSGDLRKTFANPTPLAIMGFSVGLTPLSAELMGWRGSGGSAQATIGATLWFGGVLLLFAGVGEWILGNTFPFIVFMGYGCHFLTFGTSFIPFFNGVSAYTSGTPYIGGAGNQMMTPMYAASYGFYPLALAILSFIFLICSLRTNLFFFLIFVAATMGFGFATASFWYSAVGAMGMAEQFLVATGGCFWAAAMFGWYLLFAIMIPTMELPIPAPPIVDLSTVVKAKKPKQV
ncbi:transcriptional activator of ethanol catabolism [Lecanosticta acicola]|uniref:Transcriptional activator of ethanol catabolism n=1 Tax=Lecanosticta acicola TaxID=111012 RepID=A0AAI9ECV9_9PEZI|nr:transcriptional activator of ethanol catabolism [Lecanosticta acicola]